MKIRLLILALCVAAAGHAQPAEEKKQIAKLCGCFDVEFKYAETFSPDEKYTFHARDRLFGRELVLIAEQSDRKLVLQHLLVIDDTTVIKHWREDWIYEDSTLLVFKGNATWAKQSVPRTAAKEKWTQTVWEVDDRPRYQGAGAWITTDNKTVWESTVDAPLPRREYTHRSDYNILRRDNRIVVADSGWVHEQDNDKILQTDSARKLIAQEKGINAYTRIDERRCALAKGWWEKNNAFWKIARDQWGLAVAQRTVLSLKKEVDGKRLDEYFSALSNDWSAGKIAEKDLPGKIGSVIGKFL